MFFLFGTSRIRLSAKRRHGSCHWRLGKFPRLGKYSKEWSLHCMKGSMTIWAGVLVDHKGYVSSYCQELKDDNALELSRRHSAASNPAPPPCPAIARKYDNNTLN
jgi:hypothetical protein